MLLPNNQQQNIQRNQSPSPPQGSYGSLARSDAQLLAKMGKVGDGPYPDGSAPNTQRRRKKVSKGSLLVALMVMGGLLCIAGGVAGGVYYVLANRSTTTVTTGGGGVAGGGGSATLSPALAISVSPAVSPTAVPMAVSNPAPLPPPGPRGINPISVPTTGAVLGALLDYSIDTPGAFNSRMALPGGNVTTFMAFLPFPITSIQGTVDYLSNTVIASMPAGGYLILSVEPTAGLSVVTAATAADLAEVCRRINVLGTRVIVRFAHEMNGGWYTWGGKPTLYAAAYRIVADAVHGIATRSAMLWSPNNALNYPWTGGTYFPAAGTADYTALDTNGDGTLTAADDPFTPYWPGEAYVDFIGTSLFYQGVFPCKLDTLTRGLADNFVRHKLITLFSSSICLVGTNSLPPDGYYNNILTGVNPFSGAQILVADLYNFTVTYNKPFIIAETGIFHNPLDTTTALTSLQQKQAWWRQVFTKTFLDGHPLLKIMNLFEVSSAQPGESPN
ncbi:hypothetical protein HDU93_002445 [Gonapodya sp. JEL0774]|nr:hypothetical protein HDU93_002445 [Gonapodya sp. JEL0774]